MYLGNNRYSDITVTADSWGEILVVTSHLFFLQVGDITILVNNAAVVHGKSLMDSDDDALLKSQHINTLGQFWVRWALLSHVFRTGKESDRLLPVNCWLLQSFSKWCLVKSVWCEKGQNKQCEGQRPEERSLQKLIFPVVTQYFMLMYPHSGISSKTSDFFWESQSSQRLFFRTWNIRGE